MHVCVCIERERILESTCQRMDLLSSIHAARCRINWTIKCKEAPGKLATAENQRSKASSWQCGYLSAGLAAGLALASCNVVRVLLVVGALRVDLGIVDLLGNGGLVTAVMNLLRRCLSVTLASVGVVVVFLDLGLGLGLGLVRFALVGRHLVLRAVVKLVRAQASLSARRDLSTCQRSAK